jgi:proteasome-associated ATPase
MAPERGDKDRGRVGARRREGAGEPRESESSPEFDEEFYDRLSALQLMDLMARRFTDAGLPAVDLLRLRHRVEEMEEVQDQARAAVEKLSEAVEKLRAPALRTGTYLARLGEGRVMVCVSGADYVCSLDPELPEESLEPGMRVLLNEAFAVTTAFGYDSGGPVAKVQESLPDGRLRVGHEGGVGDMVVNRSTLLAKEKLKAGAEVRLDSNQRVAIEALAHAKRHQRMLERVEPIPWEAIGGQAEAVEAIRDTIELPYLHADLFRKFKHPVPKGFLLYGPPGCGKTLLGKATAYNLRQQIRQRSGEDRPEFFLHVKGPEILSMWLGESERQVRELFAQCREKAAEGRLAFLFIDEAESVLGTRTSGRFGSNILSTLVPMFCAEMDGLEPLQNVVVILASNRADLIDPAILRPGRIDRKIRARRPDAAAAKDIYRIYVTEDLPLAEPATALADAAAERHYERSELTGFLEIVYRSGRREVLSRGDLASGAIIAAIVERGKEIAIKRSITTGEDSPLTRDDLFEAIDREYRENELFPPSDNTEDWLKLTDFNPADVVSLKPYRAKSASESAAV